MLQLWLLPLLSSTSYALPQPLPQEQTQAITNSSGNNNQGCVDGKPCTTVESLGDTQILWGNTLPWHVILQLKDHEASPCVGSDGSLDALACDGKIMNMPATVMRNNSDGEMRPEQATLKVEITEDENVQNKDLRSNCIEVLSGFFNIGMDNRPVQPTKLGPPLCAGYPAVCRSISTVNDGDPVPQNWAGNHYVVGGQDENGDTFKFGVTVTNMGPPPEEQAGKNCDAVKTATTGASGFLGIIGAFFPPAAVAAAAIGMGGMLCGVVAGMSNSH